MINNDYWKQRWESNNTSFHLPDPNGLLVECLPGLPLAQQATVFVPFCGASVDMVYLIEQGYQVIGSEISELACETFFQEQQLNYELVEVEGFNCYQSENVTIYCGDHYQLKPEWFQDVTVIYDRAAFVAVEPAQRKAYVRRLKQLVPNFKSILIVQEYDEAAKQGPPFSLNEKQILECYSPISVTLLGQREDGPTCENLRGRGFVGALECCYWVGE